MKTVWTGLVAVALIATVVVVPVLVAVGRRNDVRHFHVVREGVLYRSAQPLVRGLAQTLQDHGIRTIVNLRDGSTAADQAEEAFCQAKGVRFVRIKPLSWLGRQGDAPVEAGLRRFLEVMADPANHPVLIHCFRGVHRTGGYVAVYRMELEGWKKDEALAEMRNFGYVQLDEHADVAGYFDSYRPTKRYTQLARIGTSPLTRGSTR
ncbi:MAG: tyrosine-protein phosphatase [Gemmataceae bacterium]